MKEIKTITLASLESEVKPDDDPVVTLCRIPPSSRHNGKHYLDIQTNQGRYRIDNVTEGKDAKLVGKYLKVKVGFKVDKS